MSGQTGIPYADAVWDPTRGCSHVSPGCKNCWAESMAKRFCGPGLPWEEFARNRTHPAQPPGALPGRLGSGWTRKVALIPSALDWPLHRRKPQTIFVCSKSDLFHEALSDDDIGRVFEVIANCHSNITLAKHTFLILTKRPARMREWIETELCHVWLGDILPNVWLGVSVEDRAHLSRLDDLVATPAAHRWVSFEPLLEDLSDLTRWLPAWRTQRRPAACECGHDHGFSRCPNNGSIAPGCHVRGCECTGFRRRAGSDPSVLDAVIVGGESGAHARPCAVQWVRSIRDQCKAAGVPCYVKQLGANARDNPFRSTEGRVLHSGPVPLVDRSGADPAEWPEDLRCRELAWPLHKGVR